MTLMPFPKIGNLAPKFALQDHEGNAVSLSDFKGKSAVVVYFYPKAMTPGCTVQAQGLRDTAKALKKLNTVVLGISPDPIKKLAKFVERDALNFQLLSDEDHAVADSYGAWGLKKFMGREFDGILRTTFIVGKDGKLKAVMDKFKTKDHHTALIAELEALALG
jgi:peroxiredoxin Q/BCP